jgi:hypothetical protein
MLGSTMVLRLARIPSSVDERFGIWHRHRGLLCPGRGWRTPPAGQAAIQLRAQRRKPLAPSWRTRTESLHPQRRPAGRGRRTNAVYPWQGGCRSTPYPVAPRIVSTLPNIYRYIRAQPRVYQHPARRKDPERNRHQIFSAKACPPVQPNQPQLSTSPP